MAQSTFWEIGKHKCRRCKQFKNTSEFSNQATSQSGLHSWCKPCCQEYMAEWRKTFNGQKNRIESLKLLRKKYLRIQYGLSPDDYDALLKLQNGLCAVCKLPETARVKATIRKLAIDHCHKTGKIRGLLCAHCNIGIGHFRENIVFLENAINYLNSNKQKAIL